MSEENSPIDEYAPEFMRLLLMQLLLDIRRSGTFIHEQRNDRENLSTDIEEALRYIDQNYAHAITLGEVAQQVSLSPAWLSSKFKTTTGVTFKEYLTRIRIRQAAQALLTTDDSITKIAMDCGFNSSNYFKDCFRKEKGHSPREYRREGKKRPLH
ncbi:MAG: AraC family transcriptional regulator [Clostridiales bacterium]|nr:AraC family transcriptional regulator [Clostridiales bacterium]